MGFPAKNGLTYKVSSVNVVMETMCGIISIPYCITIALVNSVRGNVEEGLVFCGADTWKQEKMQSVREVIQELMG